MKKTICLLLLFTLLIPSCNQTEEKIILDKDPPKFLIDGMKDEEMLNFAPSCFGNWNVYDHSYGYTLDLGSKITNFEYYTWDGYYTVDYIKDLINVQYETELSYFSKEDGYELHSHIYERPRIKAGAYKDGDTIKPSMFKLFDSEEDYHTGADLEIIKYNDVCAYSYWYRGCVYNCIFAFVRLLTYMNEENPFDIYFQQRHHEDGSDAAFYLFFIPKDKRFSKKCISKMADSGNVYHYNCERAKELIASTN